MKKSIAALLLAVTTVACAGRSAQIYVQADTAVVETLGRFKAEKDVRCDAGEIPASSCEAIAKAFVPVWEAYLEVNALITAEAPIERVDASIDAFKASVVKFRDALTGVQENYRKILLDILEQALRRVETR